MQKSSLLEQRKIDIFDNLIANLNAIEFFDHDEFKIFSSMTSRMSLFFTFTS